MKHRGIGAEEIATKALRAKRTAMREFSTCLPPRILEQNFSIAREMLDERQCRTGDRARISVNRGGGKCRRLSNRSIEASEDLSELASDDSESRSKIEAMTGVGNEQER